MNTVSKNLTNKKARLGEPGCVWLVSSLLLYETQASHARRHSLLCFDRTSYVS